MKDSMKAVSWTEYGAPEVLTISRMRKPDPADDEVLVRVHAATVTPGDCEIRRFDMHVLFWLPLRIYFGLIKPGRPILGMELSGTIIAIGKDVGNFSIGDEVIAGTGLGLGAYAEYKCVKSEGFICKKPAGMSFEEAATLPTGGINALHYMRKAALEPGQKILIKGAAGCFGTYAVQLAKLMGAEVTGVDRGDKLEAVSSIGADHVIDYLTDDYTQHDEKYDVIFDVRGDTSIARGMKSLTSHGRYILATPWVGRVLEGLWCALTSDKKFVFSLASEKVEDLAYLGELVAAGKLQAVLDRTFSMDQISEAHRFVEEGGKTGHVAVTIP